MGTAWYQGNCTILHRGLDSFSMMDEWQWGWTSGAWGQHHHVPTLLPTWMGGGACPTQGWLRAPPWTIPVQGDPPLLKRHRDPSEPPVTLEAQDTFQHHECQVGLSWHPYPCQPWSTSRKRRREGVVGRDATCQGQNSSLEPVENGADGVMGLAKVGPELVMRFGVNMVLQS